MVVLFVALAAAAVSAQPDAPETLIRMTVDATPAPRPALRYTLLPELREMTPGNPIPNYLTAFLDPASNAPGRDYPTPQALRQADRAARMDRPDWGILTRLKVDGIGLLLPDVQKMRELAGGLQARYREEVAVRDFPAAVGTAQTMFAMARHMGEHPTLIGSLVGIAIAHIAIGPFEEMLQQPGCPNLYWALTHLPDPLVGTAVGLQGERTFILGELKDLSETDPMTPVQLRKVMRHVDLIRGYADDRSGARTAAWVAARVADPKQLAAARARLLDYGLSPDRVDRFPPEQVVLLDARVEYEEVRDDDMKYMVLPTWEALARLGSTTRADAIRRQRSLFGFLTPALYKVRVAQGRLEQRLGLLRAVEAVRLYAAAHGGRLPATLAELPVPVPVDAFTGKPFRYELAGDVAHLRGTPPPGLGSAAAYNLHYEITIRK